MRKNQSTDLDFEYEGRLVTEQLGKNQYSNPISALTELICNSFDADATEVKILINQNQLSGLKSIVVSDNGFGISGNILKSRFVKVGVHKNKDARFGKFGVGRFAVFKLGSFSSWKSVYLDNEELKKLSFQLIEANKKICHPVIETVASKTSTGTTITIENIDQKEEKNLTHKKIEDGLITQFFSFLLTTGKNISINGEYLNVASKIKESTDETSSVEHEKRAISFNVKHIILNDSWKGPRHKNNIHFCLKGRLIASESLPFSTPKEYLALVESDYFDEIISSNREALASMDEVFLKIKESCLLIANNKSKTLTDSLAKEFLEVARSKPFYPYSTSALEPTHAAERAIYDVVLEKVHEEINLENCTEKHQKLIFQLIKRSLKNANLLEVINEILNLQDEDLNRFKKVLSRTTLEQIIKLSDEITTRLQFLDQLQNIVYGTDSKFIKERAHLHKVLEKHPWIFGDKYHLSTSDKSFKTVIQKLRATAGLAPANQEDLAEVTDYNKIPDLCFISKRDYPIEPKHHNLLVELKAPKVSIGQKELGQIKTYGNIILKSAELPKNSNHWDLFLVSSDIHEEINMEVNQKDRPIGLVNEQPNMKIWVLRWSDIIQKAKDEMTLVRDHLKITSDEISTVDYIKEEFPFIDTAVFKEGSKSLN